jgi:hypothetical protein
MAASPELERLVRIESKLSQLMENVGINPRLSELNARASRNDAGDVEVNVNALAVPLGEILTVASNAFPHTKEIDVLHRGRYVCRITTT